MKSYRKPYRVKRKKPILKNRFFGPGILFFIIAGSISYFLFFSGIFQIKNITIVGAENIGEENIKALVPQNSIFFIEAQKIKKEILENFPEIAKAELRRVFPNALEIALIERRPVALWCESEKCLIIDKDGVIFQEAKNETGLIKISGPKEAINQEKIAQILGIKDKLRDIAGVTTTLALIVSEQRLNVTVSEGWEIYFNTEGDLDWQIRELGLVLEKQISPHKRKNLDYVDLRFSRVYYK